MRERKILTNETMRDSICSKSEELVIPTVIHRHSTRPNLNDCNSCGSETILRNAERPILRPQASKTAHRLGASGIVPYKRRTEKPINHAKEGRTMTANRTVHITGTEMKETINQFEQDRRLNARAKRYAPSYRRRSSYGWTHSNRRRWRTTSHGE